MTIEDNNKSDYVNASKETEVEFHTGHPPTESLILPNNPVQILEQSETNKYRTQWSQVGDTMFRVSGPTLKVLQPGLYQAFNTDQGLVFERLKHSTKQIIKFDDSACDDIVKEIDTFWNSQSKYKAFDVQYKRGILFHGPQGSGKSSIIKLVIQDIISRGGIALVFNNPHILSLAIDDIRAVEKNKPIVVIMEDLDTILERGDQSAILNVLDGSISTIDNVLFLATTNYPEMLEDRIKDRPSRFDRVIEIPCPTIKMRGEYIETLFKNAGVNISEKKLEEWAKDTENFSFSHITEMFLSVELYGKSYKEALDLMVNMSKKVTSDSYKTNKKSNRGVGFKYDGDIAVAAENPRRLNSGPEPFRRL